MTPPSAEQPPQTNSRRKRRKLRHPRATRACTFCRKRKVRCSGTLPCEYCIKEDVSETCEYGAGVPPPSAPETPGNASQGSPNGPSIIANQSAGSAACESRPQFPEEQQGNETTASRRSSFEPPQMFAEDQHVGPTAGISFLYHTWNKGDERSSKHPQDSLGAAPASCSVPLDSYGDFPQSVLEQFQGPLPTPLSSDQIPSLLERYFRFATPTYRYMHRPTLEKWTMLYFDDETSLENAQRACVLLACAQSLLYTVRSDTYVTEGYDGIKQSRLLFQKAKGLLDRELGPPSLASVQSRLAMCLYMLSTFRMTACRFCFSLTATILTSLGLHRVQSTKSQRMTIDSVESESRRRTFWCAYVLDGYLSVMLGRPRILRDEDVDQPYPRNIDDNDLLSSEPIDDLPPHGNLEAFFAHASLAKLMARNSDLLYPLHTLTEDQVLQRSNELLDGLESWRQTLPNFLKPGNKTLTGERMFERQNTVLKLAHAHMRILITRRCLLSDTSRLGHHVQAQSSPPDLRTTRPIQECVAGITSILDTAMALTERGALFHCFWFTQYIVLVAASTLYVFLIQGTRQALPTPMDSFIDVESYFGKAKKCQRHLDALAPPGSQAKRHHQLLDHLRCRVERGLAKIRRAAVTAVGTTVQQHHNHHLSQPSVYWTHTPDQNVQAHAATEGIAPGSEGTVPSAQRPLFPPQPAPNHSYRSGVPQSAIPQEDSNDPSLFPSQLDPTSDTDQSLANMLDLGWASLDTIGFMMPDASHDFGEQYQ